MRIAIMGASGHGRAALDCLRLSHPGEKLEITFYDDQYEHFQLADGVEVRGPIDEVLCKEDWDWVFVAIGDNAARMRIAERMTAQRLRLIKIVHPHTAVSPAATIGDGSIAIAGVVINTGARLGRCVIVNTLSSVGHDCEVRDYAQLGPAVNLGGAAIIGQGAFLGIGAKVAPEVRIGAWSIVGAGSVVLDDVPDRTFCFGTPARVVRSLREDELPDEGKANQRFASP
jgi:acetyltransferase EpsM